MYVSCPYPSILLLEVALLLLLTFQISSSAEASQCASENTGKMNLDEDDAPMKRRANYSQDTKGKVLESIKANMSVTDVSRSFHLR